MILYLWIVSVTSVVPQLFWLAALLLVTGVDRYGIFGVDADIRESQDSDIDISANVIDTK